MSGFREPVFPSDKRLRPLLRRYWKSFAPRLRTGHFCLTERAAEISTRGERARRSGGWTKRIDQRVDELQRIKDGLTQCIGCGCLSIDKWKLANPANRAGRRGPGPPYWLG